MPTEERKPSTDEALGMAWWNSLSEESRAAWAAKVGTGVVADAWTAFKRSVKTDGPQDGVRLSGRS